MTANVQEVLSAKAEAACSANVPVWPQAPTFECRSVQQTSSTMLMTQADTIINNADPQGDVDAYAQALEAHGWRLTRSALSNGDQQRWLVLSTPAPQCLEVSASLLLRPGLTAVDLSVVYDYLTADVGCPTS